MRRWWRLGRREKMVMIMQQQWMRVVERKDVGGWAIFVFFSFFTSLSVSPDCRTGDIIFRNVTVTVIVQAALAAMAKDDRDSVDLI